MSGPIVLHLNEHGRVIPLAHTPAATTQRGKTTHRFPNLINQFAPASWPAACDHDLGEGWVYQQAGALTNTPHCRDCRRLELTETEGG